MKNFTCFVHYEFGDFKLVTVASSRPFHALVPWYYVRVGVVDSRFSLSAFRKFEVSSVVFESLCSVGLNRF